MNHSTNIGGSRGGLKPRVPIRFPHFERHFELGTADAYTFDDTDCRVWYQELRERIARAIDLREYLPIYRMGDGEYRFALAGATGTEWEDAPRSFRERAVKVVARLTRRNVHRSGSQEYGFEEYNEAERPEAYSRFVKSLQAVSRDGVLALALHESATYSRYIRPILDWFAANGVTLNRNNYAHVYSIYALLHGPDRESILRGRKILIATGLTPDKESGIRNALKEAGAKSAEFVSVSRNKSLFSDIELRDEYFASDIVLVGAGIGSVHVLNQLKPLQIPCLDVGFVLTTMCDPALRWKRPFCVPDSEFDRTKVAFL